MPYSFTQIEEDRSRTIGFVFAFLVLFYFLSAYIIVCFLYNYYVLNSGHTARLLSWPVTLKVFLVALAIGGAHWFYTVTDLINKVIKVLGAEHLNLRDTYHKRFQNIIDEVSVATGGRKIDGAVIPTMAMNAFALADFQGRAVIGVTEGLLARLNRAQLEAVVGHEAAHIVSGDCLATTVSSSMFELYSGALRGMELFLRFGPRRRYRSSGRGGGAVVAILLIYVMLLVTKGLSQLIRMFISREREYRADAVAVRLTRDPVSLAEALYGIGYHWRGAGLAAEELEAIFITNPKISYLDESEGVWAELFSTHPPVKKRIKILLDMARTDLESIARTVESQDQRIRTAPPSVKKQNAQWRVNRQGQWHGPYNLSELTGLDWLTGETFVQKVGNPAVSMMREDEELRRALVQKKGISGRDQCPKCHVPLRTVDYEGVEADKCPLCGGTLVSVDEAQRIILRQEVGFSDRIKKMAEVAGKENRYGKFNRDFKQPNDLYRCPKCHDEHARMLKTFYTAAYPVEVDRCVSCGHIWFDRDELEVLQCMIESAQAKGP